MCKSSCSSHSCSSQTCAVCTFFVCCSTSSPSGFFFLQWLHILPNARHLPFSCDHPHFLHSVFLVSFWSVFRVTFFDLYACTFCFTFGLVFVLTNITCSPRIIFICDCENSYCCGISMALAKVSLSPWSYSRSCTFQCLTPLIIRSTIMSSVSSVLTVHHKESQVLQKVVECFTILLFPLM